MRIQWWLFVNPHSVLAVGESEQENYLQVFWLNRSSNVSTWYETSFSRFHFPWYQQNLTMKYKIGQILLILSKEMTWFSSKNWYQGWYQAKDSDNLGLWVNSENYLASNWNRKKLSLLYLAKKTFFSTLITHIKGPTSTCATQNLKLARELLSQIEDLMRSPTNWRPKNVVFFSEFSMAPSTNQSCFIYFTIIARHLRVS